MSDPRPFVAFWAARIGPSQHANLCRELNAAPLAGSRPQDLAPRQAAKAPLPSGAMKHGQASRTALSAAGQRAAHQALEGGLVFSDPLAIRILGRDAEKAIAIAKAEPERRGLRFFVAMRSRFAEEKALAAIEAGVRQILVLGAGLDTLAYRLEPRAGLKVFELDHPATQRDKRSRLAEADIAEPAAPHLRRP